MRQVALKEAKNRLVELIRMVDGGEEVVIITGDGSGFKITPFPERKVRPKFGSAAGRIEMSDDFDEPLEEFEEYMP